MFRLTSPEPTKPPSKPSRRAEAVEVVEHWQAASYHGRRPLLTDERVKLVEKLLAKGLTVADCKAAVDGAEHDDWIMGRDPRTSGKRWTGIETILKNVEQVEKLRDLADGGAINASLERKPWPFHIELVPGAPTTGDEIHRLAQRVFSPEASVIRATRDVEHLEAHR